MVRRIFVTTFFLLLAVGMCYGSEKMVSLATLTDFAPLCFPKENAPSIAVENSPPGTDSKQLQGYGWDVVRESFHAMGYTIQLHVVPWERGMHYLSGKKVDGIFPANHTLLREKEYAFSKHYVDEIKMVIYTPADSKIVWQGLQSLNGLQVGFVRGWSYGKSWEAMAEIIKEPTDTIAQGFDLLAKGRLAGVAGYQLPYDYELRKTKRIDEFKIIGHFDTVAEYLMVRKHDRNGLLVLDVFDSGRSAIDGNGVLSMIERKWQ